MLFLMQLYGNLNRYIHVKYRYNSLAIQMFYGFYFVHFFFIYYDEFNLLLFKISILCALLSFILISVDGFVKQKANESKS